MTWTPRELMIVEAARALAGVGVCFVGIGPPNLACTLAQRTVAPELNLVFEAGVVGARPSRVPLSIGDPALVTGALAVNSMWELFAHHLQRGLIDVAFLAGAQIDRHGNLNTTAIGDYHRPQVRLPGSGGACEIALHARRTFILMPQSRRSFVERVDFVTSPGHPAPGPGGGPAVVVTQLGRYRFVDGEMTLTHLQPEITLDEVRGATGWELRVEDSLGTTMAPTEEELRILRDLDPQGVYLR
jgi:glutaconate CoA-transferase subunit B